MILTVKLRLKDKHAAELNRQARQVNTVWNYCNETQQKAVRSGRPWLSWIDLCKLTAGSSKLLDLHGHTIKQVCKQYDRSRKQHNKPWLRFRGRKSMGWVPFGPNIDWGGVAVVDGGFQFRRVLYCSMHARPFPADVLIRAGSFNRDARGRWYINCPVEFPDDWFARSGMSPVGIDLGLKDLAVLSTGERIDSPRHFGRLAERYGKAQRAGKKRLARNISTKIANSRKDHLHKASARVALAHGAIFVGNVSSSQLAQTCMAKSVLDAGWSMFRTQLSYKAMRHGGIYGETDEHMTSQLCSDCGAVGGPKGIAQLGIREWTCGGCGATHDRDVNAARNILARGLASLAEGAAKERSSQKIGEWVVVAERIAEWNRQQELQES